MIEQSITRPNGWNAKLGSAIVGESLADIDEAYFQFGPKGSPRGRLRQEREESRRVTTEPRRND
jgi:hypothetical protein